MEETSIVEYVFKCSRCNFPEMVFLARESAERAEDEHRDAYHPSAKRQRDIQAFAAMMESMTQARARRTART